MENITDTQRRYLEYYDLPEEAKKKIIEIFIKDNEFVESKKNK